MNRIDKILDEAFQSPLLGNITDDMTATQIGDMIRMKGGRVDNLRDTPNSPAGALVNFTYQGKKYHIYKSNSSAPWLIMDM